MGNELLVVPSTSPVKQGAKGLFEGPTPVKLDAMTLQNNMTSFLTSINQVLSGIPKITEPFKLDQIEITLEVNAEGSIQLIGGLKAGATGGITLKLTR